jgi:hypothetical protein
MSLSAAQESQVRRYLNQLWSSESYLNGHYLPLCTSMPVRSWVVNTTPTPMDIVRQESSTLAKTINEDVDTTPPPVYLSDGLATMLTTSHTSSDATLKALQTNIITDYTTIHAVEQCVDLLRKDPSPRGCSDITCSTKGSGISCNVDVKCGVLPNNGPRVCILDLPDGLHLPGTLRVGKNVVVKGNIKGKNIQTDLLRTGYGKVCCGGLPISTPEDLRRMYTDTLGILPQVPSTGSSSS